MSWEESHRIKEPCPCGKGEVEEIIYSDDWGRFETVHVMLCPACKEKYVYDDTVMYGHPGNEVEKGWTLKNKIKKD